MIKSLLLFLCIGIFLGCSNDRVLKKTSNDPSVSTLSTTDPDNLQPREESLGVTDPNNPQPREESLGATDPNNPQPREESLGATDPDNLQPREESLGATDPNNPQPREESLGATDPNNPQPREESLGATDHDNPQPREESLGATDPDNPQPREEGLGATDPDNLQPREESLGVTDPNNPQPREESSQFNVSYGVGLEGSAINFDMRYGYFRDHVGVYDRTLPENSNGTRHYIRVPEPVQRRSDWPKPNEVEHNPIVTYYPEAGFNLYWTATEKLDENNEDENILSLIVLYPPFQGSIKFPAEYTENGLSEIKLNESIKIDTGKSIKTLMLDLYDLFEGNEGIRKPNFWETILWSPIFGFEVNCLTDDPFMKSEFPRQGYRGKRCKIFSYDGYRETGEPIRKDELNKNGERLLYRDYRYSVSMNPDGTDDDYGRFFLYGKRMDVLYLPNLILYFGDGRLFQVELLRPINYNIGKGIEENRTTFYRSRWENKNNT